MAKTSQITFDASQIQDLTSVLLAFRHRELFAVDAVIAINAIVDRAQPVEILTEQIPTLTYCATVQSNEVQLV